MRLHNFFDFFSLRRPNLVKIYINITKILLQKRKKDEKIKI
jgi:hypothetical protein